MVLIVKDQYCKKDSSLSVNINSVFRVQPSFEFCFRNIDMFRKKYIEVIVVDETPSQSTTLLLLRRFIH